MGSATSDLGTVLLTLKGQKAVSFKSGKDGFQLTYSKTSMPETLVLSYSTKTGRSNAYLQKKRKRRLSPYDGRLENILEEWGADFQEKFLFRAVRDLFYSAQRQQKRTMNGKPSMTDEQLESRLISLVEKYLNYT